MRYADRHEAGQILADSLKEYAQRADVLILALPRGGVPVAYEIAKKLSLPMDIFVVRKIGMPGHAEFAIGAIASGGVVLFNEDIMRSYPLKKAAVDAVVQEEQEELIRREQVYRGNKAYPELRGKTILLVDDGIATGYSMRAAIASLKQKSPVALVIAVPVAAPSSCVALAARDVRVVCPLRPSNFSAVGLWYDDFTQTSDDEVIQLLQPK